MAYLIITLIALVIAIVAGHLRRIYSYWEKRGVPHERPFPLLGNLKGVGRQVHIKEIHRRYYAKFKDQVPFAGMYFFLQKAAVLYDLDLIKHILIKDFSSFHDRGMFINVRDDPLTGHLFALEGEQWRWMRNKLTPVFTSGKMKIMFSTLVTVAENLSHTCGEIMENEGEVELKELSARYTTDVIGTCAFGIECNSLKDPKAEFRRKGRGIIEDQRHSQLVRFFLITHPALAKKLRMKFFTDDTIEFFLGVVRSTVEYRLKNNIKRNDFMDMLIEMKAKNEEIAKLGKGIDLTQGLTLEQMSAQAFSFFLAGFDTSASTMAFCLYEMALNPDMQDQLRQEISDILKANNDELTYESMNEMKYLEQVLAETLRKYPVIPQIVRNTNEDFSVPNTNYKFEKGTMILIPVDAIHHDPVLYPEPEKFDPSRFTAEAIHERHPSSYLPFGDGPRSCIGLRFGKMQAKIGLISLLKDYKFKISKRTEIPMVYDKKNFLISAKNGIYLGVEKV